MAVVVVLCTAIVVAGPASAATIGSNLATAPNGSVCAFQADGPQTRVCTVGQEELQVDHMAGDGLIAPYDGVVVSWSVVSGVAPPGTGQVKLALRTTRGPGYLEKGAPFDLPQSSPGTRHTFAEQMPITAGQPIGVMIWVSNSNSQEAGAPIAFRQPGIGAVETWTGEPWAEGTVWDGEYGVELLLNAVIEPDDDGDRLGDLTQDCFPNHPGDQHLCGLDFIQPTIRQQVPARQGFLRSGVIRVPVASSESGQARAAGRLEIQGSEKRSFALRAVRKSVVPDKQVMLRLRLSKLALKTAKAAAADGKKIVVKVQMRVADAAGNVQLATARVRPK